MPTTVLAPSPLGHLTHPKALNRSYTRRTPASRHRIATMAALKPQIMVNSCTGKMGQAVAEATLRAGIELVPYTLCGPAEVEKRQSLSVQGHEIHLVPPETRDTVVQDLKKQYPNLVMVDYTLPDAIHSMVDFYTAHMTPFVMGTTGGDRGKIHKQVESAGLYSVIAPNMGKQIVAFQAMMEYMATNFPGAFSGYKLRVVESHQSTKKDTSGTAKAVVQSFQKMGINFSLDQIELVREPAQQTSIMKVPESALNGHAYHTYQLVSGDGSVMFEFQHNVVGRTTYAEGTVDACLFLQQQIEKKADQRLYNMIDVLRAGAMR